MKIYNVTALVKKGGESVWSISVMANNAKDAKALARSLWFHDAHLFGIRAEKADSMKYSTWTKIGYMAGTWPEVYWVDCEKGE